jgi:hypothetical protein
VGAAWRSGGSAEAKQKIFKSVDAAPPLAFFRCTFWYLSGGALVGGLFGPTLPSGWALVATPDFDGDCKPDYVLYNASTGRTAIWYMDNNVLVSGEFGPTLPAGWSLIGTADFNGDGKPDYLLYRASTGQTAIWYMNNNVLVSGAFGPTLPGAWNVVALSGTQLSQR